LGIPPNHIGTLSATTALTGAQDASIGTALNNSRDRMIQIRRTRRLYMFISTKLVVKMAKAVAPAIEFLGGIHASNASTGRPGDAVEALQNKPFGLVRPDALQVLMNAG
jgi:hypothetical protein